MEHKVNLNEISDGTLYSLKDYVPLGCDGCQCFCETAQCCHFSKDTITLDAYDIWQLACAGSDFTTLFQNGLLALSPVDMVLLPHLNFEKTNCCPFLSDDGRCGIYDFRPGLCRLFPLARGFREDGVFYLKQVHECPVQKEVPVSVTGWLGLSDATAYEAFCVQWHELLQTQRSRLAAAPDHETLTALSTRFLQLFYFMPYSRSAPFEEQYDLRRKTYAQEKF